MPAAGLREPAGGHELASWAKAHGAADGVARDGNDGHGAAVAECVVGHAVVGSQPVEVVIREQAPVRRLPRPHVDTGHLSGVLRVGVTHGHHSSSLFANHTLHDASTSGTYSDQVFP